LRRWGFYHYKTTATGGYFGRSGLTGLGA
jgi:hypothetical protein